MLLRYKNFDNQQFCFLRQIQWVYDKFVPIFYEMALYLKYIMWFGFEWVSEILKS